MAPAQLIEAKDLPPEVLAGVPAAVAQPVSLAVSGTLPPVITQAQPFLGSTVSSVPSPAPVAITASSGATADWEIELGSEALSLLAEGRSDVWDVLTRRFESRMISAALMHTKGRRIEAAHRLGIGRNTITRKIQELGLE
jgi:two-component system nitrogen regulation response regulator GlnG